MASKKKKTVKKAHVTRTPVNKGAARAPLPHVPRALSGTGKKAGLPSGTPAQRLASARALAKKLNDSFKGPVVITADEASTNAYLRRPCGIMQLDIDTGGGMPAGEFVTIGGPDNSGKSTLLYHYFAMHQRIYGEDAYCALANVEGNIDYDQARRCGWIVPVPFAAIEAKQQARRENGLPPLTDDEVAELRREVGRNTIIEADTAEEILDITRDLLASNLYGIVAIDSYEGLIPRAEHALDSLEEYAQQAARASAITRFLQHYGPIKRAKEHFTTFLMTCQVRTNRKKGEAQAHIAKYLKDWSETVPYSIKHWRQIDVTVWSGSKIYEGPKDSKTVIGKHVNWEVCKGKSGAHDNVQGETSYYYDPRCFDMLRSVVIAGFKYGVIHEKDGLLTFVHPNGEPDDYLVQIAGPDHFIQAMTEEPEKEMDVRRAILDAAGKSCIYY